MLIVILYSSLYEGKERGNVAKINPTIILDIHVAAVLVNFMDSQS